jgi:flagellin
MRINTNEAANSATRLNALNNKTLTKNVEKLSSGLRINTAGDDAAGLAISEKMRSQFRGLDMASKNTQDGISLIQTAEGALQSAHDILQRMRDLAVQSANGVYSGDGDSDPGQRASMDAEFQALKSQIDSIAARTDFNGIKPLNMTGEVVIQSGANNVEAADRTKLTLEKLTWAGIADDSSDEATVEDQESAQNAIETVDTAIGALSLMRAKLGAQQNALEFAVKNLDISSENIKAAEGRIRNVDMAKEITDFAKNTILSQASTAMIAQANIMPEGVLALLT